MPGERPERLPFIMQGKNRHQRPVTALFQDDGTIRNWAIVVGDDGTRERPVLVEPGRQLSSMLWGHDGTDPRRLLVEDTAGDAGHLAASLYGEGPAGLLRVALQDLGGAPGDPGGLIEVPTLWDGAAFTAERAENAASGIQGAQIISLYGEDAISGNLDSLVVNPIAITSTPASQDKRPVEAAAIPAAVADVFVPGLAATAYMDIELEVVNVDGGNDAVLKDLGVDYGNDGGAIDRYFAREVAMPAGEVGKRFGPYRIWGDDAIMAEANAAGDLEIHIYVIEEGTSLV